MVFYKGMHDIDSTQGFH